MEFVKEVQNDIAAMLGMIYKKSKDEIGVSEMKFIGYDIKTTADAVYVRVPGDFIEKTIVTLQTLLDNNTTVTLRMLESAVGKVQHAAHLMLQLR